MLGRRGQGAVCRRHVGAGSGFLHRSSGFRLTQAVRVLRNNTLILWGAALVAACAPRVSEAPPVRPADVSDPVRVLFAHGALAPRGSGQSAPATVVAHYPAVAEAGPRLRVDDAELLLGTHGERWLVAAGGLQPADTVAPEALIAAGRSAQGYDFVGASGSVYHSDAPLGALDPVVSGPGGVVAAAIDHGRAVVTTSGGGLLSWHLGEKGWGSPSFSGSLRPFFFDATSAAGELFVLSVPEQVWRVSGTELVPLSAPLRGVVALAASGGELELVTRDGGYSPSGRHRAIEPRSALPPNALGPDAERVRSGQALFFTSPTGLRYAEVRQVEGRPAWLEGPWGGSLEAVELEVSCELFFPIARGDKRWLACVRSRGEPGDVDLFSLRLGAEPALVLAAQWRVFLPRFAVAVDDTERLLMTGACRPLERNACIELPLAVLTGGTLSAVRFSPGAATPLALDVSPSGQRVAVLARSEADDAVRLHLSADGGRTFGWAPVVAELPGQDRGGRSNVGQSSRERLDRRVRVSVDDQGFVGLTSRSASGEVQVHLTFGPRGRRIGSYSGFDAGAELAAHGRRVAVYERQSHGARLRTSRRGLGEFSSDSSVPGDEAAAAGLVCTTHGCVLGRALTINGYGTLPGVKPETDDVPPVVEVRELDRAASTIRCAPAGRGRRLAGVPHAPKLEHLALPDADWVTVTASRRHAHLVSHASGQKITQRSLGLGASLAPVVGELLDDGRLVWVDARYAAAVSVAALSPRYATEPELEPLLEAGLRPGEAFVTLGESTYQLLPGHEALALERRPALPAESLSSYQEGAWVSFHAATGVFSRTDLQGAAHAVTLGPPLGPERPPGRVVWFEGKPWISHLADAPPNGSELVLNGQRSDGEREQLVAFRLREFASSLRPCRRDELSTTPRWVIPDEPALARQVRFEAPSGAVATFTTRGTLAQGSPTDPCLSAYAAEASDGGPLSARVLLVEGMTSWLFREEPGGGELTAQPWDCH